MNERDWLAERFDEQRALLRPVAYRMLGSVSEADDAVQEAWLRLSAPTPAASRTSLDPDGVLRSDRAGAPHRDSRRGGVRPQGGRGRRWSMAPSASSWPHAVA